MGKRLNISTTAVINTELIPLTDSFELVPNGSTEQWYYVNATPRPFVPDRSIIPLIITAKLSAVDRDTNISYIPPIVSTSWYVLSYNGIDWVETLVTTTTQNEDADYQISGIDTLIVNKNIDDATHGVQIRCVLEYADPRDNGIHYIVEDSLSLTANRDATVLYPTIDIAAPSSQAYNPLENRGANGSQYTFVASYEFDIDSQHDPQTIFVFEWYGVKNGAEVKIDTLPCYVSGQNTNTLVVDAMYDDDLQVILRIKDSSAPTVLLPPKVQRSVVWKIPNINGIIQSNNGSAVRSNSGDFTFTTILNSNGQNLSESQINDNLRFKWQSRKSNLTAVTQKGWGRKITLPPTDLFNVQGIANALASTIIGNEIYLLGAYEQVTQDGEAITDNGSIVYDRMIS